MVKKNTIARGEGNIWNWATSSKEQVQCEKLKIFWKNFGIQFSEKEKNSREQ